MIFYCVVYDNNLIINPNFFQQTSGYFPKREIFDVFQILSMFDSEDPLFSKILLK